MKKFLVVGSSYLNYSYTLTQKEAEKLGIKKEEECVISNMVLHNLQKNF